ncbi:MAG TPA: PHP domain-containing protein [Candidatus Thermoplasmatota archaeon]|nr:PHP domain-containing protein [Candidatus Thermoplasmatota archaeon]
MRTGQDVKADVVELLAAMANAMKRRADLHRARAYARAANAVARRPDFEALLAAGRLREIEGVGPAIERKILAFVERGEKPDWLVPPDAAGDPEEALGVRTVPRSYREAPFADAPDLHCHTTWSDGSLSIDELAAVAGLLGAPAVGVSDHSGSLRIARGLAPDEVRAQWQEIARVQAERPGVRILRGTECDVLRDGTLDHPPALLAEFDYVIGSLHSQLRLPQKEQTERVLRALDCERLTILGHPTTRVPGRRPRANLDLEAVFQKAAERGVAMEVNGNPGRLDLDEALARQALRAGCRLSLGSDGHSALEMLAFEKARRIAAKAGASEADLVNYDVLARASKPRRPSSGRARSTA